MNLRDKEQRATLERAVKACLSEAAKVEVQWPDGEGETQTRFKVEVRNHDLTFNDLRALSDIFGTNRINIGPDFEHTGYDSNPYLTYVQLAISEITKFPEGLT